MNLSLASRLLLALCLGGMPVSGLHAEGAASQAASALPDFAERGPAQRQQDLQVQAVALFAEESEQVFGLPLAQHGVQPVWLRIENQGRQPWRLMPIYLDKDYFSPHEVAWMFRKEGKARPERLAALEAQAMPLVIAPGTTASGYVFTNLSRGFKLLSVDLLGDRAHLQFQFAQVQPGGHFDFRRLRPEQLYPAARLQSLSMEGLREALRALPCCTSDKLGQRQGDPLNLVLLGDLQTLMAALVRGGWDFTDSLGLRSSEQMAAAFLLRNSYRNAPVSSLYFEGRPQDFAMQRARGTVSQRNHLRLWLTPLRVEGQPVWVGQISRDIGVRFTERSPTFTTHAIDPDVDEARNYLLEDLLQVGALRRYGLVPGVGAAGADGARRNLTGDPYYTDGLRLLLQPVLKPVPLAEVELLPWDQARP